MKWSRTRSAKFFAVGAAAALLLTACGGDSDEGEGTEPDADAPATDEEITLTITTFNQFGYEALYEQYMEENPNITIEATAIDTGGNARTDTFTKIAAGSGLTDIVALEEGWLGAIMEVSDQFADLRDFGIEDRKSDWLEWKYNQATDPEGRVIGYGTDIGPEGICYRPDLFELPACRASATPSPTTSRATGRTTSTSAASTRLPPARRGTTTPASSGTASSTRWTRATTPLTAS